MVWNSVIIIEADLREWKKLIRLECDQTIGIPRYDGEKPQMSLHWMSLLSEWKIFRVSQYTRECRESTFE